MRRKAAIIAMPFALLLAVTGAAVLRSDGPGPDRDRLAKLLELRAGMVVADVGAGSGRMAEAAAITRSLDAVLRPGGRLAIIDLLSPRWLFFVHHGLPADAIVEQVTSSLFRK